MNIRKLAQGQTCTLYWPGICSRNAEETVLCHVRVDHHALAMKPDDQDSAVFACHECHAVLDSRAQKPEWMTEGYFWKSAVVALIRTRRIIRESIRQEGGLEPGDDR